MRLGERVVLRKVSAFGLAQPGDCGVIVELIEDCAAGILLDHGGMVTVRIRHIER